MISDRERMRWVRGTMIPANRHRQPSTNSLRGVAVAGRARLD